MPLINALGQDLWEFLEHIDALHQNLGQYSPFRCHSSRNVCWHHARSAFPN
jgi:hypothetical protein